MIKYLVLEDEMLRIKKSCTKKISLNLQINSFPPLNYFISLGLTSFFRPTENIFKGCS